jgi:hypothetical protein
VSTQRQPTAGRPVTWAELTPAQKRLVVQREAEQEAALVRRTEKYRMPRHLAAVVGEMTPQQAHATAQRLAAKLTSERRQGGLTGQAYDDVLSIMAGLGAHWQKSREKAEAASMRRFQQELAFGPRSGALRRNLCRLLKTTKAN